ncbi:nicotinate-nucleotide--dimethylbenzimidazole phosphoribosyltransferase [Eionea flava]
MANDTLSNDISNNNMQWIFDPIQPIESSWHDQAQRHQQQLTKPPGSLGRLEQIAECFCAWQSTLHPSIDNILVAVFAGDHGVCQQQVSAFPQAVTGQMVANFLEGGAAISVLSQQLAAQFYVCNTGVLETLPSQYQKHPQLIDRPVANGTQDFSMSAAMTAAQLEQALNLGREIVDHACHPKNTHQPLQLFVGGEMGIGNTTSASAIYAALLGISVTDIVGRGAGVDDSGLERKQAAITAALALHANVLSDPYQVLQCMGGFEIAALVGSYLYCAQQGIPVVVDGFICTSAALVAIRLNPDVKQWMIFSHCSQEAAHRLVLQILDVKPLVDIGLRLGEGSGAALIVPLLKSALLLHNSMATFQRAGVSNSE